MGSKNLGSFAGRVLLNHVLFALFQLGLVFKKQKKNSERYYIRFEYETTGNDTLSGSTDLYYVTTAEGIPDQVENLKLRALPQHSVNFFTN